MRSFLIIIFFSIFFNNPGFSQGIKEKICLQDAKAISNFDYQRLAPYLKDKKMIIMGEANHGSHEFFKLKEAVIKYLASEVGLRHVVIEANFAICHKINEYITWKTDGNAKDLAKTIYVWPFKTEEFSDLIVWMREFNEGKRPEEQINLWGMDMQQAYPALKILQKELAQSEGVEAFSVPEFDDRMDEIRYTITDSALNKISQMIDIHTSGNKQILQRCLEIVKMQKKLIEIHHKDNKLALLHRDSCMAENVKWLYASSRENDKMVVWAHNSHIQKEERNVIRQSAMGYHLYQALGDQAYFIGFDFNHGTFIYPHPREKPLTVLEDERHNLARQLDDEKYDICFIPFVKTNQPLLTETVGMRYNHGLAKETYTDLYDAIFFINEVTPAKMLE